MVRSAGGVKAVPFLTGVAAALLNVMTLLAVGRAMAAAGLTPVLGQQRSFASLKYS